MTVENWGQAGTRKQMGMIGHQGPGKADRLALAKAEYEIQIAGKKFHVR
jgi:hypothetical protein